MKKNIVIVDDCYETAKLLATGLQSNKNSSVSYHTNPFKALEEIRNKRYSNLTIISDFMMPQMDGIELYDELKTLDLDFSYVVLTNENDTIVIEESQRKGIDKFILKQKGFDVVMNEINDVINKVSKHDPKHIEVFEVSDIIQGYEVIDRSDEIVTLHTTGEIPKNSIIKISDIGAKKEVLKVDSCTLKDDGIEIKCSKLKAS